MHHVAEAKLTNDCEIKQGLTKKNNLWRDQTKSSQQHDYISQSWIPSWNSCSFKYFLQSAVCTLGRSTHLHSMTGRGSTKAHLLQNLEIKFN